VVGGRHHLFVFADGGLLIDSHHEWNAWSIDVAVQQPYFLAKLPQGAGEVDGEGGLADAAFAAGDGDDSLNAGNFVRLIPGALGRCGLGSGLQFHLDVDGFHGRATISGPLRFQP